MKKTKLGYPLKLKYIPFIELVDPNVLTPAVLDSMFSNSTVDSIPLCNSRSLETLKSQDQQALEYSIRTYNLLKPLEVVELSEKQWDKIKFHALYDEEAKKHYAILDGQRRYFVIAKMIGLPRIYTREPPEQKVIRRNLYLERLPRGRKVLIPCLVYPYTSFRQMRRHSVEDNKFSIRPKGEYLDCAERMDSVYDESEE